MVTRLPAVGVLDGAGDICRELKLEDGGVEKMRASFHQEFQRVNAIRFDKGDKKLTYGNLLENGFIEWEFSEESPLMGLYGH